LVARQAFKVKSNIFLAVEGKGIEIAMDGLLQCQIDLQQKILE
jgi:hypothetical protein